jgi:hypothetical protein
MISLFFNIPRHYKLLRWICDLCGSVHFVQAFSVFAHFDHPHSPYMVASGFLPHALHSSHLLLDIEGPVVLRSSSADFSCCYHIIVGINTLSI